LSNEIAQNFTSGETLYACRFQLNGHVFLTDGASDEEWGTGGRDADDYDVTLTESGDSGHYVGDFDGSENIAAGIYRVAVYLQIGANPANSDPAISQGTVYWDGSACASILDIFDKLPTNYIMGSATKDDQDAIILSGTVPDNTSTANSIKLAADASGTNDIYNENLVVLVAGTGAGQARLIADYIGAVRMAAVRNAWLITPDNTTQYRLYPFSGILLSNTGLCAGATGDTITLNASAQAVENTYVGHTIFISGGTGYGQARLITGYTAGRVATVSPAWDVTPGAAASIYLILPVSRTLVDSFADDLDFSTAQKATLDAYETSIIAEIDENETKIDAISAETGKVVYGSVASGKVISGSVTGFVEDEKE